jgi:uncharacterized protein YfaP (DUF2135 family)
MPRRVGWFCALALLLQSTAPAAAPGPKAKPRPLKVSIETPTAGIQDGDHTLQLEAQVSDPRLRTALLSVNGAVYEVPVRGGRIEQTVVVVPGNNRVGLVIKRGAAVARDSVTFYMRGKRTDLVVLLTWAARGEIIDLWVREPGGETCKWDHRQTRGGGRLLDFSQDAIGFGSQAFVLPDVRPGRYRVKVHYWGAYDQQDGRGRWSYEELIQNLDEVDQALHSAPSKIRSWASYRRTRQAEAPHFTLSPAAQRLLAKRAERAQLQRRLDKWALPGAPQTPVHGEAILFPGTRYERRWRFALTSQRTGQLAALGEVEVTAAMIRAARASKQVQP